LAYRSGREYFFHRRPIGLDPSAVVATVATGRNADLGKFELRSAASLGDIVDGDETLAPKYGYPLKLRIATKLGFKNPKWIMAMYVTNRFPGGFWEDRGYNWFGGI
jgi:hypothetical protein